MPRIKVTKAKFPRTYWPKDLVRQGFSGEMEVLSDAVTAVVVHPDADLTQVRKSLELVMKDVDLRIEQQEKAKKNEGELGKE